MVFFSQAAISFVHQHPTISNHNRVSRWIEAMKSGNVPPALEVIDVFNLSPATATSEADVLNLKYALVQFLHRYPFSASLPVQPLTYSTTPDGVNLTFLRKKTDEKSGRDGGIQFSVDIFEAPSSSEDRWRLVLEARRNSDGQTISKAFSERKIVKDLAATMLVTLPGLGLSLRPENE